MAKYVTEKSDDYSILDNNTGEVLDMHITKKVTIDEFIMVFFASCHKLMELKGNQLKVLICCWKHSSYNPDNDNRGNIIHNNPSFKDFCKENGLDVSNAIIDNSISVLCKKDFLKKKCRGEYLLNPEYFFKGRLTDRSKVIMSYMVEPSSSDLDI